MLGQAGVCAAVGVGAGIGGAIAVSKLMADSLIGIRPAEPLMLGAASAALLFVAIAAAWLPAMKASRIDPAEALVAE